MKRHVHAERREKETHTAREIEEEREAKGEKGKERTERDSKKESPLEKKQRNRPRCVIEKETRESALERVRDAQIRRASEETRRGTQRHVEKQETSRNTQRQHTERGEDAHVCLAVVCSLASGILVHRRGALFAAFELSLPLCLCSLLSTQGL